jgi:protein-disulfide isomerase
MRKIWFCLIALASFLVPMGMASAAPPPPAAADAQAPLQITRDDRILGNPDAPITIVEYASMTCPHCAHFQDDVLPEIKKQWIDAGKAKLVLRDFPLDEEALRAAMIARCAPPDRYYAFADTFFASQSKWVGARDYREALARLARLGGMGKEEFEACLRNKRLEDSIVQSRLVASKELDVNSTPTFFINGNKFTGAPTAQDFEVNLQAALPAAAAQPGAPQAPATPARSEAQPQTPVTPAPSTTPAEPPSAPAQPSTTATTPTPAPAPPATPKPSSESTAPSTQAPRNVAEATPAPAAPQDTSATPPTASADAGHAPEGSTIWDRLRGWFQGLFGSHS